jgi:CCR4-NOT complex subunit CAF16
MFGLQGDITAGKMIFGVEGVDSERRRQLVQLLDIDLYQRLTTMSDGQRRRVQICMGLLKPYDVSVYGATDEMCTKEWG